jgi:hypothetical protein
MKKSELLQCIKRLDDRIMVLEERVRQLEERKQEIVYVPYTPYQQPPVTYPTWGTPTVTCEQSRMDKMRTHTG